MSTLVSLAAESVENGEEIVGRGVIKAAAGCGRVGRYSRPQGVRVYGRLLRHDVAALVGEGVNGGVECGVLWA